MNIMWIIIAVIVVIAIIWVLIYNNLIKRRNWVDESFSQIDVQLQRRNDLIPNLVNTVKGYASHERETLESVTQARQQLINLPSDADPAEINAKSNELSGALSRLLVVAEQYPDLKANTNFTQLQSTLDRKRSNKLRRHVNCTTQLQPNITQPLKQCRRILWQMFMALIAEAY